MPISSPGVGSGLDVNSLISQLMAIERRPVKLLDTKEIGLQAKLTAYGTVKGALSSLQSSASALSSAAKFSANTASAADASVISATASSIANLGTYSIEVSTLAKAHSISTDTSFTATTTALGSGTITLQQGTYSAGVFTLNPDKGAQTITIDSNQNTLAAVRDKINGANAGVTANIVNDGSGFRLVITSQDSGAANALKITTVDDDANNTNNSGLSQLNYDASTGGSSNATERAAATNAALTINGLPVSKASNTITDAIHGVTLNLLKTNVAAPTTLTVARDSSGIQSAVQGFVKAYNDAHKALTDISAYNATTKQAGQLQGDSTVRTIQTQLHKVLNTTLSSAGGGFTSLSDIGINFQKDGTITLNSTKLQSAISDNTKDISTLFASVGKSADSLVSFQSAGTSTKAGVYGVNISQIATQATAVGSLVAGTTITSGLNDTLTVTVDGNATTVTLSAGTYTATTLAAEIQSKINGSSTLVSGKSSVAVTQSGGLLTATSARYGLLSTVVINGGNAAADLFGTAVSNAGVDVAGNIGGTTATGSGQTLTATGGDSNGLSITVTGGVTGDRGNVSFANGYAYQLNTLLSGIIGFAGAINSRTTGINNTIADIGNQRINLNRRLTQIEQRYRTQFTALDVAISNMTKTSNFLTQQLANLPKPY